MNHPSNPRYINKPPFIKIWPRARIIYRQNLWHVHILTHPIDNPDKDNQIVSAKKQLLPTIHHHAARHATTARAEQETP